MKNEPEPGWTTRVKSKRVVDADTVEVEITRTFKIRLREIDAPERGTPEGEVMYEFLRDWIEGKNSTVFIPSYGNDKLMDMTSFERLEGDIWHDGVNIVEELKRMFPDDV